MRLLFTVLLASPPAVAQQHTVSLWPDSFAPRSAAWRPPTARTVFSASPRLGVEEARYTQPAMRPELAIAPALPSAEVSFPQASLDPRFRLNKLSRVTSAFSTTQTPFAQHVKLPVVRVWSGRLQFEGFDTVSTLENVLRGLPGEGNPASWSIPSQGRRGVLAPGDDESYGLCLTLHWTRQPSDRTSNQLWHGMTRVLSFGRGLVLR